jgi:hypothetical protein
VAVHLYGVSTADAAPPEEVTGRRGAPLRLLRDDELSLLVSDVAADAAAGRRDLLEHARVLEAWVAQHTVLPMRFGMVVETDDEARARTLEAQRSSLLAGLDRFDGMIQLSVQATHAEEPALREVLRRHPALLEARRALASEPNAPEGARQLELGRAVENALRELREEDAGLVVPRVVRHAVDHVALGAMGVHDVVRLALLVRRDAQQKLDEEVAQLRADLPERLTIRYVGPQPPYAFLEALPDSEVSAWA